MLVELNRRWNLSKEENESTKVICHMVNQSLDSKSDVTSLQIHNNDSKIPTAGNVTPINVD